MVFLVIRIRTGFLFLLRGMDSYRASKKNNWTVLFQNLILREPLRHSNATQQRVLYGERPVVRKPLGVLFTTPAGQ